LDITIWNSDCKDIW